MRNPGTPIDGPIRRYSATVVVTCAPRAAIAYGRIADEQRLPAVLLEGGGVVRATRIPLADEDAWIAYLPDTRVLGLAGGGRRGGLAQPAARERAVRLQRQSLVLTLEQHS